MLNSVELMPYSILQYIVNHIITFIAKDSTPIEEFDECVFILFVSNKREFAELNSDLSG